MEVSLDRLCELFGFTRQTLNYHSRAVQLRAMEEEAIVNEVRYLRGILPRCGGRKLYVLLQRQGYEIGRDRLFEVLRRNGLLVPRRHYRIVTTYTYSWMRKYPNLIKDLVINRPDQAWVSDITYIQVKEPSGPKTMYLSLVTDAFTHEIVGHALHDTLDTEGPLRALQMALNGRDESSIHGLIHHSDRGCQYCSAEYVGVLKAHGIDISMTSKGDPYENAIAERLNGILKTEWLYNETLTSVDMAQKRIDDIVFAYNNVRPHMSIGNLTPVEARSRAAELPKKLWKNYWLEKRSREGGDASHSRQLADALP